MCRMHLGEINVEVLIHALIMTGVNKSLFLEQILQIKYVQLA